MSPGDLVVITSRYTYIEAEMNDIQRALSSVREGLDSRLTTLSRGHCARLYAGQTSFGINRVYIICRVYMTTGSNNIKSSVRRASPAEQKIKSNNGKNHAGPSDPVIQ